ncbi:MAG: hypothetical protein ACI808_003386, partial [Paraglaciecola sp.]
NIIAISLALPKFAGNAPCPVHYSKEQQIFLRRVAGLFLAIIELNRSNTPISDLARFLIVG